MSEQSVSGLGRRQFLGVCSMVGLGQTLLPGALFTLATQAEAQARTRGGANAEQSGGPVITDAMIDAAAAIAGIKITDDQKKLMMNGLRNQMQSVATIRELHLPNSVAPAVVFDPVPAGMVLDTVKKPMKISAPPKVVFERSAIAAGDDLRGRMRWRF